MVHFFRLFRKWITGYTRATELFMNGLGKAQIPAIRSFALAVVWELVRLRQANSPLPYKTATLRLQALAGQTNHHSPTLNVRHRTLCAIAPDYCVTTRLFHREARVSRVLSTVKIALASVSDDWLSRTMRTVEAVMEQHGFVEDPPSPPQQVKLPSEQSTTWDNLLQRFNLLRRSSEPYHRNFLSRLQAL